MIICIHTEPYLECEKTICESELRSSVRYVDQVHINEPNSYSVQSKPCEADPPVKLMVMRIIMFSCPSLSS